MGMSVRTEYYRYTQYVPPDSLFARLKKCETLHTESMK